MNDTISKLKERYERDPDSLIFAQYADYLRKNGQIEEAIGILEKGIQRHPNYATAYLVLGRCYKDKGLIEPALIQLEKAVELDPQNILSLREISELHMKLNNIDAALKYFEHLLNLDPLDDETRRKLNELKKKKEEMERETEIKISEMSKKDFFSYFDESGMEVKEESLEKLEASVESEQNISEETPSVFEPLIVEEVTPVQEPIKEESQTIEEMPISVESPKEEIEEIEPLASESEKVEEEHIIEEAATYETKEIEQQLIEERIETAVEKEKPEEKIQETLEPRFTIELANIYFNHGFKEKGIKVLEKILEMNPGDVEAKEMLMEFKGGSVLEEIKTQKPPVEEQIEVESDILKKIEKERSKLEGGDVEVNLLGGIEKEEAEVEKDKIEEKIDKEEKPKTLKDIFGEGED